jgi:hypothetical protein
MSDAVPSFVLLDLTPDTILINDSTDLSWQTLRADSVVVNQGVGKLSDPAAGSLWLHPNANTSYRAIAYNDIGTDTGQVTVRVETPFEVDAEGGRYYRGEMGSGITAPEFRFRVLDAQGLPLRKPWMHFSVIEGDGVIVSDSVQPDANGAVLNDYTFSGNLGYGVVRAAVREIDSIEVNVRASVIRFGTDGQGQYVRFSDNYAAILALNGDPLSIDPDPRPDVLLNYADYENSLGVVFAVLDANDDNVIQESEGVIEVILTALFTEVQSPEGVGVGTSIHNVRTAYGTPDTSFYDAGDPPDIPPAWGLQYDTLGALFYASVVPPDSAIIEIHMYDPSLAAARQPAARRAGLDGGPRY